MLALVAAGGPGSGRACEFAPTASTPIPAHGATGVPRDTLIVTNTWSPPAQRASAPTVTIVATGATIALEEVTLPGLLQARAFRPQTLLPPDTDLVVGEYPAFRTGTTESSTPGPWTLVDTRYQIWDEGCGFSNSCGETESFAVVVRGEPASLPPLFHLFLETAPGVFDATAPTFAFMSGHNVSEGEYIVYLDRIPNVDFGSRVFLVPVGPSGRALGAPIGPVSIERDRGGCSVAPHPGGRLVLFGLVLVSLWWVLRSRGHALAAGKGSPPGASSRTPSR